MSSALQSSREMFTVNKLLQDIVLCPSVFYVVKFCFSTVPEMWFERHPVSTFICITTCLATFCVVSHVKIFPHEPRLEVSILKARSYWSCMACTMKKCLCLPDGNMCAWQHLLCNLFSLTFPTWACSDANLSKCSQLQLLCLLVTVRWTCKSVSPHYYYSSGVSHGSMIAV